MKQLSDSYFDESPVKKTSSSVKSRQDEVEESEGSDSDKDTHQSRQAQSKKAIQTKSTDVLEFRDLMDRMVTRVVVSKTTESTVHCTTKSAMNSFWRRTWNVFPSLTKATL